ncbi:hypothetical protein [Fodinibius saliphilus]|uniref:hypothetical protein n=1 Tax=Fodinibius saliphilus TaxID=1920650 RepID=UPI001108F7E2|nr:hypothetical protein [Fodinibius saliphilus]
MAQETDTTQIKIKEDPNSSRIQMLDQSFDRSISGGSLTQMGTHEVPRKNQYYQAPFKGQIYLDQAVEAYREEIRNKVGDGWFWNFLKSISPYIKLELGAFETMQMEYVDRDNPLWKSYSNDDKLK